MVRWRIGICDGTAGSFGTRWAVAETRQIRLCFWCTALERLAISGTKCSGNFLRNVLRLLRCRRRRRLLPLLLVVGLLFCGSRVSDMSKKEKKRLLFLQLEDTHHDTNTLNLGEK